jgi:uncharacterized protein (TIGR01777 family)
MPPIDQLGRPSNSKEMSTILITGGSGLIGTALTRTLLDTGHTVRHLSRTASFHNGVEAYAWNIERGTMDERALEHVEHIVHLAGAGIADKRWTDARVKTLIDSRSVSARLLLDRVRSNNTAIKSFVSAAGINYYGAGTTDHIHTETDPPGMDTIARISIAWEEAVDEWASYCRVVKLRTPIVLAPNGGALQKLAELVRWGIGSPLGTGAQWVPWIHMNDLVRIYEQALFREHMDGAYNVNTGNDVTNADLMRTIAQVLRKAYFLPNVPGLFLKLYLGELSSVLLEGSRASNTRLMETKFMFEFPTLKEALIDLLDR